MIFVNNNGIFIKALKRNILIFLHVPKIDIRDIGPYITAKKKIVMFLAFKLFPCLNYPFYPGLNAMNIDEGADLSQP